MPQARQIQPPESPIDELVSAVYPILIPIEQQDLDIQLKNYKLIEKLCRELYIQFEQSQKLETLLTVS